MPCFLALFGRINWSSKLPCSPNRQFSSTIKGTLFPSKTPVQRLELAIFTLMLGLLMSPAECATAVLKIAELSTLIN